MMRPPKQRYRLQGTEKIYCGLNLVATAVIFAAGSRTFFHAALAAAVVFLHITGVVLLASGSIRLRTSALLSCLTVLATLLFLPVIAVNLFIWLWQRRSGQMPPAASDIQDKGDTK